MKIRKRDGSLVEFDKNRITNAIFKAAQAVGGKDIEEAKTMTEVVLEQLSNKDEVTVEEVGDLVETMLIKKGHAKTAKAYILYRAKRAELRALKSSDLDHSSLMKMFVYKGKLSSLIGFDRLDSYKRIFFSLKDLQKCGEMPLHHNYLNNNEMATTIYKKKYYLKDIEGNFLEDKPEDVFIRISAFMASVEKNDVQLHWAKEFYNCLFNGYFLPGGRVLAGAGDLYRIKTLANCFVTVIEEDSLEGIYKAAYECARTYSYGGGIGVDVSTLRPRDSIVHNAADNSTGSVSFMELYSLTTGLIGQSGRRGALMITLDVKHPDVLSFINVKKNPNWVTKQIKEHCMWTNQFSTDQLDVIEQKVLENTQVRFANISLKVSDEFMHAVLEENNYKDKFLLYKRDKDVSSHGILQGGHVHYSYGIPSKPIEKYDLIGDYPDIHKLNEKINSIGLPKICEHDLKDSKRDMFGDLLLDEEFCVRKAGDFMLYFNTPQTGEVKKLVSARTIWDAFVKGNYKTAEPGLIFWSTMIKNSPSNYVGKPIASTNPCGEVPLEDGGACNLASLNLSRFVIDGYTSDARVNWETLSHAAYVVTRFLDNVVTWNEKINPLEKQRIAAMETRRLGIGIMGIADMLNQLGLEYDCEKGINIIESVMKFIANRAYQASAMLSEEKGQSPIYNYGEYSKGLFFNDVLDTETKDLVKEHGLRNIALLSIAPTGTISNVIVSYVLNGKNFIGVSSGVEPIFALYYKRRSESFNKTFNVFHSSVEAYLEKKGLKQKIENMSCMEDLKAVLPAHFFRTAHEIDPKKRVIIQGRCQRYVDHSISSTVNLPEDISPEVISQIYIDAWQKGLKGITVYRAGSRFPVLSIESDETAFQTSKKKTYAVVQDDKEVMLAGDTVITMDDGSLSTVYHSMLMGMGSSDLEALGAAAGINDPDLLVLCPSCGNKTLKMENGCNTCLTESCGFSKCDI